MFSFRKKPESAISRTSLRRRFHHFLLRQRKTSAEKPLQRTTLLRPRRNARPHNSPAAAFWRRLGVGFALAGTVIGGLYLIFFSSFFAVTKIDLEKNGNSVAYTQLAPFLENIRGKNILFITAEALATNIEKAFPNEILFVDIQKSYPKKLKVIISEHPAVLNFLVKSPEKTQRFVVNNTGYAILENTEEKNLPTILLEAPKPLLVRTRIIEAEKITQMHAATVNFYELFGMKIMQGEWKKRERELHLKTEKGFMVWLDLTGDVDQQLKKLKRALPKLDIYKEPLEYIDLRIAGADSEKVIFKRKG